MHATTDVWPLAEHLGVGIGQYGLGAVLFKYNHDDEISDLVFTCEANAKHHIERLTPQGRTRYLNLDEVCDLTHKGVRRVATRWNPALRMFVYEPAN